MENKYGYYERLKDMFLTAGIMVAEPREINYGLQFNVELEGAVSLVRIFESAKSGTRCDLSQVRDAALLDKLTNLIHSVTSGLPANGGAAKAEVKAAGTPPCESQADIEENALIGTDESGKGDYFGPLVIAGVYADAAMKRELRRLGAADSKKLSQTKIASLSQAITSICPHSIVTIGNSKYNELYRSMGNLNRLLAWGHARAIENLLSKVECSIVLSDQFGNPELIKSALMKKGKSVLLEQRPRAEENVVVAAASIIARNEYVERMKALSEKYGLDFPKGASSSIPGIAKALVEKYGETALEDTAKLHFKTTNEILGKTGNTSNI